MDGLTDSAEIVFRTADRGLCSEAALVLEAAGLRPVLHDVGAEYLLVVPGDAVTRARREIEAWQAERRASRPEPPLRQPLADGRPGVLGYALLMVLVALCVTNFALGKDWLAAGRIDGAAMRAGEWWRAITALTLHADVAHMAANIFFGGLFGWIAGRYLGSGLAWLLILLGGICGNLINVVVLGFDHRAIGASTAVFAALGLLGSLAWAGRRSSARGRLYRWGPIIGAVALLAYTGAGGERTDIGAHIWGFAAGLGVGMVAARMPQSVLLQRRVQLLAGLAALAAVTLAWALALAANGDTPYFR